jgi:hypothetical protein
VNDFGFLPPPLKRFFEGWGFLLLDFCLLLLNACSPVALVLAQRCRYARRRLLFSASPEKSNQKRGDFFVKKQTPFYTGTRLWV